MGIPLSKAYASPKSPLPKDADSFIITNENSLVSLNNVFQLDNFKLFQETIQNDIKFLMSISSSKFNLLILYYEYETNIIKYNNNSL